MAPRPDRPNLEAAFKEMLRLNGIPLDQQHFRFHPARQWEFDFAWPALKLAVEVDGAGPGGMGRHQRHAGYVADCEKFEAALLAGWRVYRIPGVWIAKGKRRIWRAEMLAALRNLILERIECS